MIELFANQLAKVSFPDIDAGTLRRLADELRAQAKEVARIREALDAALASFVTRLSLLTETATRAVAYARIYSVAHPDQHALAAALAALPAPAEACATAAAASKRRGRGARRDAQSFDVTGSTPPQDDPV